MLPENLPIGIKGGHLQFERQKDKFESEFKIYDTLDEWTICLTTIETVECYSG